MAARGRIVAIGSLCAAAILAPCAAWAQGSDPAAAEALFRRGREAAEKKDWATACPKFAESQRLDPAPGTLLNLAECEEHLGLVASAYEHYRTAAETLGSGDDRLPFAKQRMASVARRVPHLTLEGQSALPPQTRVMRDDVELGTASFGVALPIDPGAHSLVVAAPGHASHRVTVTLAEGQALAVTLEAGALSPPPPPERQLLPPEPGPREAAAARPSSPLPTVGIVVAAVGVASLGAGAVTGAMVLGKKAVVSDPTHCNQATHVCDATGVQAASDGRTLSTLSTVAFVAGGALVVVGAVVFLKGRADDKAAPSAFLAPELTPEGAGLRLGGTF
jgi:hypothetical protein